MALVSKTRSSGWSMALNVAQLTHNTGVASAWVDFYPLLGMDLDAAGVVVSVATGGCAERAGVPVGGRIVGVDDAMVESRAAIIQALSTNFENPWARFRIVTPTG